MMAITTTPFSSFIKHWIFFLTAVVFAAKYDNDAQAELSSQSEQQQQEMMMMMMTNNTETKGHTHVFLDQMDDIECRCYNHHPRNFMMRCTRKEDGAFFGTISCPHAQTCVEPEDKFAPYWESRQDFCRFNSMEDQNLAACERSLDTESHLTTEEIFCKTAHEYLIDCFKRTADDGSSQCLYERHRCSSDEEYVALDGTFPYGNWSQVCHQKEEPTPLAVNESSPLEPGSFVTEQLILEGLDSYFYCLRPDDWKVSCNVTNIAEEYSTAAVGEADNLLSFGVFGFPYSTHFGPANQTVLFYDFALNDYFSTDVRIVEENPGYGVFLRITSRNKIIISRDNKNEYDAKMIFSDEYLNELVDAFTAEYNPDGSTKFFFYDMEKGEKNQDSLLAALTCTGFRPMALYRGRPYDEDSVSCARDSVEVYAERERVWPPTKSSTDAELKMGAICGFVSGSLSFLGSVFIFVVFVYRCFRLKESSTRERLLIGMSFLDVFSSLSLALGPIPSPVGAIQVPWVFGNTASCEAQGFGIQLGFGVPLYNSALCLYYLLVLVFHKSADGIHPIVEAFFHAIPLGFALTTACTGAALNLFNTNGRICWIEPSPYDCKWNKLLDCTRGTPSTARRFIAGAAQYPLGISCLIISISMLWITVSFIVQAKEIKNRMNAHKSHVNSKVSAQENEQEQSGEQLADFSIHQTSMSESMKERNRTVYIQALLYVAAFFLTYIWVVLQYLAQWTTYSVKEWVHTCSFIFWPLQGFWNFFIVFRPTYMRMRCKNPELWFPVVFWKAIKSETSVDPESRLKRRPTGSSVRNAALMKSLRKPSARFSTNLNSSEHVKRSRSLDFNSEEQCSFDI